MKIELKKKTILTEKGDKNNVLFIYNKHLDDVKSFLNNTVKSNFDIKGKLYPLKSCKIERSELKEWCLSNGYIKTNRKEQSDVLLISKDSINSLFKSINNTTYNRVLIPSDGSHHFQGTDGLSLYSEEYIRYIHPYFDIKTVKHFESLIHTIEKIKTPGWRGDIRIPPLLNELNFLIENKDRVIFEEDILTTVKSNEVELTDEYLDTINSMFESKEQDNIDLALEMMSQVDLELNYLTIALTLNRYLPMFVWGSGLSIKKHRNFKPIDAFLKSKNIDYENNPSVFYKSILSKAETEKEKEIVKTSIKGYINQHLGIKVKDISI